MKRSHLHTFILLCALALLAGCVPAPRQGDGRLKVSVSWDKRAAWRSVSDISSVTAILTRQSLEMRSSLTVDQTAGTASGEIGGLYAGEWNLKIEAAMADGTVIYAGQTTVTVVSGETRTVAMILKPAPGKLDVTLDVSTLIAQGKVFTEGKIYIYQDPASGTSTYRTMTLEGSNLHALVELASRTYDAKIAVPNTSDAIFTSAYFQFDILSGQTTTVTLKADGGVGVYVDVVDAPGRVTAFTAVPSSDHEQAVLSWTPVAEATGYRVYRTDSEGRFVELTVLTGGTLAGYTDTSFTTAKPYAGVIRYAVAALAGEVEGLRSEPATVTVE